MSKGRLVIIGGDAAGMSAAAKVRRLDSDREIVVFERGEFTSYSACGMPYWIAGLFDGPESLIARSPQTFRDKYSIDVRTRHEVVAIDPDSHHVEVVDRTSGSRTLEAYDQLLIATGARPFCPQVPGSDARGILGLSHLATGIAVEQFLRERKPQRAVVVGGGYIGLEMAEALLQRGLAVALVQRSSEVMSTLDRDMGALVSEALREAGVELLLNEQLQEFKVRNGTVCGVVTYLRTLEADMVILGMGTRPRSELAEAAGLRLGDRSSIEVDKAQQTSVDGIWAAGDCASVYHLLHQRNLHIALGTVANKSGTVAGSNLAGVPAEFPGVVGTAVSKICTMEVARTGLQEKEALDLGLNFTTTTIESRTRSGYYPGSGRITVKLLGEKGTGRLLGGQIVGLEGSAKRIDVLATALHAGMTVEQLVDLDLAYAPPFSPVWDPVQTAARALLKEL